MDLGDSSRYGMGQEDRHRRRHSTTGNPKNLNMFKFFSKFTKFGFAKRLAKSKLGGDC
jgi:hypothetical protein